MAINGVDPSAKKPGRIRRDWARVTKGAATASITAVQPLTVSSSPSLGLNIASNAGLTPSGQALSILLRSNSGLSLSNTGLGLGGTLVGNLTISGTLSVSNLSITAVATNGTFLAGAVGGPPTVPSFRAITANDLPGLLNDSTIGNLTVSSNLTVGQHTTFSNFVPTLPTQTANTLFAGPSSGAAAVPAFRAAVVADLPGGNWVGSSSGATALGVNYTLTGSFANIGCNVTLPSAGTYILIATMRPFMSFTIASGGQCSVEAALLNTTDVAFVANTDSTLLYNSLVSSHDDQGIRTIFALVTVAALKVIDIQARLNVSGAGSSASGLILTSTTSLIYVRVA